MEDGGLNVKSDPEGTQEEGTRGKGVIGGLSEWVGAGGHDLKVGGVVGKTDLEKGD